MTIEETKSQLEELIKDRESFMVGDYDEDIYDRDKEALVLAVKAVEKQIPKKLTWQNTMWGICPNCKKVAEIHQFQEPKHCEHCGQALDWSGADE